MTAPPAASDPVGGARLEAGSSAPPAAEVALVARVLAGAGLVEGFGHVSARAGLGAGGTGGAGGGDGAGAAGRDGARAAGGAGGFLISSTDPLAAQTEASIHLLDAGGAPLSAGEAGGVPLEAPLHAAIYAARPDVGAICRTHSRAAVVWGVRGLVPPLLHGLGGLGGTLVVWDGDGDLVVSAPQGAAAAAALGAADGLLVRGNGVLVTGADLRQAAVRAWFLEERARVALEMGAVDAAVPDARARHYAAEEARAWRWLRDTFG